MIDIIRALNCIDPAVLSYSEWIETGMALKSAGQSGARVGWQDWDVWSRKDPGRFHEGECERKWNSFTSEGITQASLIRRALDNGYEPFENQYLDWDDTISYDGEDPSIDEFYLYIDTLFEPGETIGICVQSRLEDGKYKPASAGFSIKREQLLRDYSHYKGDLEKTIGNYNHDAGGWIHFNPVDGQGMKAENVTDLRYCLVECDTIPMEEQLKKIYELRLPCAAIVNSGGKSIHAIMRVDAPDIETYKKRVGWIFKTLTDNGLPVDPNNKNPNRMSRLPGLERGEQKQELIEVNTGYKSFSAWEEYVNNGLKDIELPEIRTLEEVWTDPPELAPELIYGILRRGHKMIISGPSKAGKSFALIQLALAAASGTDWMGFGCRKSKVLYINLEIDEASFINRTIKVYEELELEEEDRKNFYFLTLRGKIISMDQLANKIIERCRDMGLDLVIIDPTYKVQQGDENSAGDIGRFTQYVDKICEELGCSVVYSHHHSKGFQDGKRAMDRGSGSGVFARDADAIIDMVELSRESFENLEGYDHVTAYRIEGILREFENFIPFNVFFRYPLHELDKEGILDDAQIASAGSTYSSKGINHESKEEKTKKKINRILEAYDMLADERDTPVPVDDVLNLAGIKLRTLEKYITEMRQVFNKDFFIRDGKGNIVVPAGDPPERKEKKPSTQVILTHKTAKDGADGSKE